jgi:xanthine dehydrogenase accessory factor
VATAAQELAAGRPVVRAVIVKTWGSTPREVGADMLIQQDGSLRGTIGGGCGEAEVYELGQQLLASLGSPGENSKNTANGFLYHVDLTENPDDGGDKVCGGRFDVLLQRLDPEPHALLVSGAHQLLQQGGRLTWLSNLGSARPGFWRADRQAAEPAPDRIPLRVQAAWREEAPEQPGWSVSEQGEQLFLEPLGKTLRLVIVGAGHIARPLCRLASELGYRVFVLDDRADYARPEFFPEAVEVVAGDYVEHLPGMAAAPATSVVLVTRGHKHDQDCLRLMAEQPLDYLGMIGSQRRIEAVYRELVEEGIPLERLRAVHAPIGLEIGAQTPAEIAISILAQMIMRRRLPQASSRLASERARHLRSLDSRTDGATESEKF